MRKTCVALVAAALAVAPFGFAQDRSDSKSDEMQRAIQFQRAKDRDDARQERKERVNPSVNYDNSNRRVKDSNAVPDPGERQVKKDKNVQ